MDNHLYQVKYRHASDWVCPGGYEPVVPLGNFWAHCTDTESDWGGGKQRGSAVNSSRSAVSSCFTSAQLEAIARVIKE